MASVSMRHAIGDHVANDLPAKERDIAAAGSEMMVYGNLGGQKVFCLFHERLALEPGERIHVTVDPALTHIFDKATGQAIRG